MLSAKIYPSSFARLIFTALQMFQFVAFNLKLVPFRNALIAACFEACRSNDNLNCINTTKYVAMKVMF